MKRIAVALFAFSFVAAPAHADLAKAIAGSMGMAVVPSLLCGFTVFFGMDEDDPPNEGFDRTGFFIGGGADFAGEDFSDKPVRDIADIFSSRPAPDLPGPEATASADHTWSVNGYGGYRCHPRYSVAVGFQYFGGFDTQWTGNLGTGGDDIDIFTVMFDIKGYLLTGRYQPYVLFGGGTMHVETSVTNPTGLVTLPGDDVPTVLPITQSRDYTDFAFRFGGGIDFYATEHVVLNFGVAYTAPLGDVSGVNMYTVGGGVEYRF